MTNECIRSLLASEEKGAINVIVVESNKQLDRDAYSPHPTYFPEGEFNYNRFCRYGIERGNAEWVTLANNDLIFHPLWFSAIHKLHMNHNEIESFGSWNSVDDWHEERFPTGREYYLGFRTGYELSGWCITAKRSVFDRINLDQRVSFWYSDNIYADEIKKNGICHALVKESRVDHLCSQTLNTTDNADELTEGQYDRYKPGTRNMLSSFWRRLISGRK